MIDSTVNGIGADASLCKTDELLYMLTEIFPNIQMTL
jgi:hypothetical protein